jgi:hypothetical protein
MPFTAEAITLTRRERGIGTDGKSRTLPAGDVFRARLVLLLAEGLPYRAIQERLDTTAPTIVKIGRETVQRIWHKAGLKPHRLERYMASDDPDFERKAADFIGLYLNPSQHAAVFCVDEKTAIQALRRLDPVLPMSPGCSERHGFEYYRHGTLSLYAALEVRTGKVQGKTAARTPAKNLLTSKPSGQQTLFWTTCQRTRPRRSRRICRNIQTFISISRRPTLPG